MAVNEGYLLAQDSYRGAAGKVFFDHATIFRPSLAEQQIICGN